MSKNPGKDELLPVDLGHLEDTAKAIVNYIEASEDDDRTQEYRDFMLTEAKDVARVLVRDFRYIFDTKNIGGIEPYGLSEKKSK